MNLTHLRYMVEVERLGSITKAASALYMGQPNLSKAIKEMEREVGIPICTIKVPENNENGGGE